MTSIVVRGAREHNLRDVDLELPRGRLIAFTGPSGSGKSSLAFDTLHAEGQRRFLEALALHARGLPRGLLAPEVDDIRGLPPTIALDQRYRAPSARLTVGTYTELHGLLAVIFGRAGEQHCPRCGTAVASTTHDEIVARLMALPARTRLTIEAPLHADDPVAALDEVERAGFSRIRVGDAIVRLDEIDRRAVEGAVRIVVDRIRVEPDRRDRVHDAVRLASRAGAGVVVAVTDTGEQVYTDRPWCLACRLALPELSPRLFNWDTREGQCPTCQGLGRLDGRVCESCGGTRLSEAARAVIWEGHRFHELDALPFPLLVERLREARTDAVSEPPTQELLRRVEQLLRIGLEHLSLHRSAATLSTGELQRLRLARQVGARLAGVLYVLDEPTAGLHSDAVKAVIEVLRELVDQGNTVLVVEHDLDVVRATDRVVDFGPGAGRAGGRVVFEGSPQELLAADTSTGRWLSGRERLERRPTVEPATWVRIGGLQFLDLDGVDVELPTEALVAITGPSGSGKTTLLEALHRHVASRLRLQAPPPPPARRIEGLERFSRLILVDRTPGRSARSNPATYTGLWEVVRELLASTREAQIRGLDASHFSLNVKGGRCEACQGTGERRVELDLLPDVYLVCPVCDGRRFTGDVLEVRWKGLAPDEILGLTVEEAHPVLAGHPKLDVALRALMDVGLGYVPLGQPTHTLSGGEAHRLRLARELARAARSGVAGTLYLVDDPTSGLHPADVAALLEVFRQLVREGGTVWMATHHTPLTEVVDWQIVLGPGAGPQGGRVLRQGTPP